MVDIPAWISNHMFSNEWDEITYPFPNVNDCTVEVLEWIGNFIPLFTKHVIAYPCCATIEVWEGIGNFITRFTKHVNNHWKASWRFQVYDFPGLIEDAIVILRRRFRGLEAVF